MALDIWRWEGRCRGLHSSQIYFRGAEECLKTYVMYNNISQMSYLQCYVKL